MKLKIFKIENENMKYIKMRIIKMEVKIFLKVDFSLKNILSMKVDFFLKNILSIVHAPTRAHFNIFFKKKNNIL